jgi:hypothetical protein
MDRKANTLGLVFELSDGTRKAIHFARIREYKVSEIYFQNVVSRLPFSSLGNMTEQEIVWTLAWMMDRDEKGRANLLTKVSKDEIVNIQSGRYFLFYLLPSVGAEVGVVAEEMAIGMVK